MCTHITMKDFITVHHEMAHIQYFLKYKNLPKVFRDGANPGKVMNILKVFMYYSFILNASLNISNLFRYCDIFQRVGVFPNFYELEQ